MHFPSCQLRLLGRKGGAPGLGHKLYAGGGHLGVDPGSETPLVSRVQQAGLKYVYVGVSSVLLTCDCCRTLSEDPRVRRSVSSRM